MVIKGLHVRARKVTWAGTQCSEFFSQARHILCQYSIKFAAMVLNSFTVFNILLKRFMKTELSDDVNTFLAFMNTLDLSMMILINVEQCAIQPTFHDNHCVAPFKKVGSNRCTVS